MYESPKYHAPDDSKTVLLKNEHPLQKIVTINVATKICKGLISETHQAGACPISGNIRDKQERCRDRIAAKYIRGHYHHFTKKAE